MQKHISDNVRALRINKGLSQEQFARIAGVSQSAVSAWECGTSAPHAANIQRIIDAIPGLVPDDILSSEHGYAKRILRQTQSTITPHNVVDVPLFGSIAAGTPLEMIPTEGTYAIPAAIHKKHPRAFLLRVRGESMNRTIPNGSYALVDPSLSEARDGKVFAVSIDNLSATIKRIHILNNGIELQPDSLDPTFASQVFDYAQSDTHTLTILGQVVWYTIPYGFAL